MRSVFAAALAVAGLGCGPRLTDLRCLSEAGCQDVANPFLLHLAVDFTDGAGDLKGGFLDRYQDGRRLGSEPFDALVDPPGAVQGTLRIDFEMRVPSFTDGRRYSLGVQAKNADGSVQTNMPTREFVLGI